MAISSPAELLDWLAQNQFLSAAQTDTVRPLLASFPDNRTLAKELIRRDWLTPFQINQILQGKHDQLIVDAYRLRERIGEGAMGQVYKAVQPRLERIVAVKMIHKELVNSGRALDRFRREVETAAQLHHPNIARVLDAGDSVGRPYLVMEFVDGINLSQRIKQDEALPIHEAVEYARQTALGLQHALERGIVHRDIKPANLLVTLTKNGDAPLVKILDFGLARFESEREDSTRLTEVGKMLGTIDYVAPEQATEARDADIRADIYSLGCTLFYLLTARPAFQGDSVVEKLGPRVTGDPPWIRTVRADIPPGLEEVIRKMMARRPDERFQTPIEAAQALAPYANEMALAPPPGVALAMPIATNPAGDMPMAQPIPAPAYDPAMATLELPPLALPVRTAVPSPGSAALTDEPAFQGMTATGRDISGSTPTSQRPPASAKTAFPARLVLILGGGALLFSLIGCACVLSFLLTPKPDKPNGTLRITKAKWSMGDEKAIPGKHHHVLVWIERVDFKGPVKVTLKNLPPGVTSDTLTIPPNADRGQLQFTVAFGTNPVVKEVKVFAECEDAGARAEMPLTLTVTEDPWKVRK